MEYSTLSLALLAIIFTPFILRQLFSKSRKQNLPPGPRRWPIIGNIHLLGDKPHSSIAELSKKHGPIMSLQLGTVTTIVVSSPEVAKEMFLKHDLAFSSRSFPSVATLTNHNKHSVVYLPVCPKWRDLRKIAAIQLFTNQRLDASQVLRQKKVKVLVEHIQTYAQKGAPVDLASLVFTTSLNLLSNTFFSMDLAGYDSSSSREFKDLVWHIMEEGGMPNVSDFFPILGYFDLQGVRKRGKVYLVKLLRLFEKIIDERLANTTADDKDDVLNTLLNLVKTDELSLDDVKHLLIDLFVAGTHSTSSTIEWAMTELLRTAGTMEKAQAEVDQVIGKNGLIKESDVARLPYLQAVVKETMRFHPVSPLLVPRKVDKDEELCGYFVPKNSQVWVNVWAMGRDPKIWDNAHSFSPERFLGSDIDMKGQHFELLPFGSGRRICPGIPLASRMLHLSLATLLYTFNWKPSDGIRPEDIDVEEKFGITLSKVNPLHVIPVAR